MIADLVEECYSHVMRDNKPDSGKDEVKPKVKDNTKSERMLFMTCVTVFVVMGLYTLIYDVSVTPFLIVAIIVVAIFAVWFANSDRL